MFEILEKQFLTPATCRMRVYAPRLARSAAPGQFLIVRVDEVGERIPLTISDYDAEAGTVTIVTQNVGASTADICSLEEGEAFADVVGPLGKVSEFVNMTAEELAGGRYVFIAGGVGTAPVYPQVKWLHSRGVSVDVIVGARTKDLLIYTEELEKVCDNLYVCTDDGSAGFHGLVTALLEDLVAKGHTYNRAVAIGPMIMMKFATATAVKLGIPVTVSLNTLMVDGTGMCGACRVTVGGRTRFACVDGPEFDGSEVDFDEAMRRQRMYSAEEKEEEIAFEEVSHGYSEQEAVLEAGRCLHCKNPRCVAACPVNIKIPDFIERVKSGDFVGAADVIAQDSSLPAICGRVCPQETQCEGSCVLGIKSKPVSIGKLERFVADWNRENGVKHAPVVPPEGAAKVAVIGSGPAGLACANDLARMGYAVTVFEALHKAGGVLQYGIPEFRLPKDTVLSYELENIRNLGVRIETDVIVGRTITIDQLLDEEGFSAVFVGTGAGLPKFMNIPGENLNGVFSANEILTRSNLMKAYRPDYMTPVHVGRKVIVVGGGNVAMDAARTALRLGAETTVVYRRTEAELPARAEEVHHAKQEGIKFCLLTNPVEILGDENGWVKSVRCIRMELGEPDASGRRSPVEIPGSEFEIEADTVVMALGTSPNPLISNTTGGLEVNRKGGLVADEGGATTRPGVFAGGDAVSGAATVILAMGAGRRAARSIDEYIKSK